MSTASTANHFAKATGRPTRCISLLQGGVCAAVLAFALTAAPASQAQQQQYVSDSAYIPLRTGQGSQYRIRMNLKTGDRLTVTETTGDWSQVTTEGGTDGWVENQYLTSQVPAKLQLENATKKVALLEQQLQELKGQNRELTSSNAALSNTEAELQRIKSLSASAIALEQNYRELEQKHGITERENEKLSRENNKLKDDQRLDFMVYGAGILLCGVLVAIVVPALKPKKRHSEWR